MEGEVWILDGFSDLNCALMLSGILRRPNCVRVHRQVDVSREVQLQLRGILAILCGPVVNESACEPRQGDGWQTGKPLWRCRLPIAFNSKPLVL